MYRVNQALDRTDLSGVELLYIDETSFENGHGYVTLVCDQDRRIMFACEGKNSETINRLAIRPKAHNGRRESIGFVSCDLGEAYPSGVRRNFFKARVVYDEFHAVAHYRGHRRYSPPGREEPGHQCPHQAPDEDEHVEVSGEQLRTLECSIEDYCELAENYRFKNLVSDIYRQYDKWLASEVLDLWHYDAQAFDAQAMRTASESIYSRRERILAWCNMSINSGFVEAVNNIQITRRMARGFKNIDYFIAIVCLCNGRLEISFD